MLRSTHCHRMCGSLLLLCLLAGPGPVAGGESLGSTTYDLSAVRSAVQRVLVEARAEMARAKPLPGAAPPPPLTMQLGFVSDSGEVTVEVGTDSRCVKQCLSGTGSGCRCRCRSLRSPARVLSPARAGAGPGGTSA